jgi:hypothetical protein
MSGFWLSLLMLAVFGGAEYVHRKRRKRNKPTTPPDERRSAQ